MAGGFARRSKITGPGTRPGRHDSKPRLQPPTPTDSDMKYTASPVKRLLLSLDYGTKTAAVAWRFDKDGDDGPFPSNVYDVHFFERDYSVPQVVAWNKDGDFIWGFAVEDEISKGRLEHEEVLELWKLLLYREHESSELVAAIREQLDGRDLHELISTHLREIIKAAKDYIKQAATFDWTAEEIDGLPLELFLSVPQMWKAPANLVMTKAAKAAGIERVELVYEPQCAAAFYTFNVKDKFPKQVLANDTVIVADLGGGTGDFVKYQFCEDSDAGAQVKLKLRGQPLGALCGSQFVNDHFLTWLKKKAGNFAAKCKELGLTQIACLKQASAAFDTVKHKFTMLDRVPRYITIRGRQTAKVKLWDVEITDKEMAEFFAPVVAIVVANIDELADETTKFIIIPGGFGRSQYLLNQLRNRYHPAGITVLGQAHQAVGAFQPVTRGALLRYKSIETRGVPSKESFGIAMIEIYDPVLHPDATIYPDEETPGGMRKRRRRGPVPNPDLVEKDPYDSSEIVYERWQPILAKGTTRLPGQAFSTETWQQGMIETSEEEISVQVYWTESNIKEHEPIREGRDCNTPLKKGIECWGEPLVMKLPDLGKLGFDQMESDSKGWIYEIYYRLVLFCDGANIAVKWQLALPGTEPYDEQGEVRASQVELTEAKVYEICDASHNPFPRVSPY